MKRTHKLLEELGLTETEIEIYLTGLSYSSIGVSELEKQTRVKRTTIYHALNTLIQKGLMAKKSSGERLLFNVTDPNNLKRLIRRQVASLEEQEGKLEKIIPLLRRKIKEKVEKIQVSHYEGLEGVKLVVEEALYCKNEKWDIISPKKNFFSEFSRDYARYFMKTRQEMGIVARSLWEMDPAWRILTPEEVRQRNPRFLPKNMRGKFKSVIIIFDDKVALISSIKELSAILIQSKELHDTMETIFEGLWRASESYQEYLPELQKRGEKEGFKK